MNSWWKAPHILWILFKHFKMLLSFAIRILLPRAKSGSTAICALIQENMLYIAWLGDSQATLVRNGMPVKVVDAHKPNRDDERARIEGLGGTIMHWGTWRVNGQLAVLELLVME